MSGNRLSLSALSDPSTPLAPPSRPGDGLVERKTAGSALGVEHLFLGADKRSSGHLIGGSLAGLGEPKHVLGVVFRSDRRSSTAAPPDRGALLLTRRERVFVAGSLALFAFIFTARLTVGAGTIDLSHYFYLPIALLAVATGPLWGALAGMGANGLYAMALTLTQGSPGYELGSTIALLRFCTFVGIGIAAGSLAHRNRELLERLQREANHDHLTGLLNLRGFEAALARRRQLGRPFALLLGDVDSLKEINDRDGHAEGNEALQRTASALTTSLREEDDIARLGGDEFALLTTLKHLEAAALAEILEKRLASKGLAISFGWAIYPDEGEREHLFELADKRLYEQKSIRKKRDALTLITAG